MTERRDVYAYFWVEDFDCPPESITTEMGAEPSLAQGIGEALPHGEIAKASRWERLSPLPRGENLLEEYLECLVAFLEGRTPVVQSLSSRYSAGINCVGYFYGSNPGPHLSASLIERIAALKLAVDFDLYNYGEEDAA